MKNWEFHWSQVVVRNQFSNKYYEWYNVKLFGFVIF